MKKMFALILTALMLCALFTGCGAESAYESYAPTPPQEDYSSQVPPDLNGDPSLNKDGYGQSDDWYGGESYLSIDENAAKSTDVDSVVTFSLKIDTASYTNVHRYIESGTRPPADAVRTEELINYFKYDIEPTFEDSPFALYTELGPSPFSENKVMAFVRVKAKDIDKSDLPPSNLTFLIDTSGSMDSYDKLPLLQQSFTMLVDTLDERDTVSIVTYAGNSAVVLDSVSGAKKSEILYAIDHLSAGGSTAGADGINTAYDLARKNFREGGNNRVILATDGDFNVGVSSNDDLSRLIQDKRDSGIYLSILGFGTGNIRDDLMETLSKDGNGNYSYIDSVRTAKKVLVNELTTNLFAIAGDVKAQVEFNPENVKNYRLIGYENRQLHNEDFTNDTVDAGEIGVGTDIVLLFELTLAGDGSTTLKYGGAQRPTGNVQGEYADELFEVRIRYKNPGQSDSREMLKPVTFDRFLASNSSDYNFACGVAGFGHLLRQSEYRGSFTLNDALSLASANLGRDTEGYRADYVDLLRAYQMIGG